MIVIGYQTLEDRDNIDEVEEVGPFKCTRPDAWLGHGYYFWDTNIEWAKEWGINSFENKGKEYIISKCSIDLTKGCFDLFGSVEHQLELIQVMEVMKASNLLKNYHKRLLPNIIQYMQNKGIFKYKSIRASDNTNKVVKLHFSLKDDRYEHMIINQRVQICVIEKLNIILRPNKVIYPEKYLIL